MKQGGDRFHALLDETRKLGSGFGLGLSPYIRHVAHTRRMVLITGFDVSRLILPRCPDDSNSPQKEGPTTKVHSNEGAHKGQYAPSKVQVVP